MHASILLVLRRIKLMALASLVSGTCGLVGLTCGADEPSPVSAVSAFDGQKTEWPGGFNRYDFVMDEPTLAIRPSPAGKTGAPGQPWCVVVVPKKAIAGYPWSWRDLYPEQLLP
jgi:hypothetical protein